MKKYFWLLYCLLLGTSAFAAQAGREASFAREITVPAGQILSIVNTAPSVAMTKGQSVNFVLNSDFSYNGTLIAPAGSRVDGTVIDNSKVRFYMIVTNYGLQVPISALKTDDGLVLTQPLVITPETKNPDQ
jgi:hypothetical protein